MDANEKMTELKKAYADMILNTTKEAAARIMVSERKAHRLELELKYSKENALQMLMRLKQTMDSKIHEAEMASRNQQKKIEELEAQLQEAEDIVKDLREELSELERAKPKNKVTLDSISIAFPPPNTFSPSDIRDYDKDEGSKGQILYNSLFPSWKSYINNQDLPAIILRSKGSKLYRSGCTHRIHACEGTLPEQTNVINPSLITETDEEGEKLHKIPSPGDERKKDRKRGSPNRIKRTLCPTQPLDEIKDIDHVADNSCSTTARSADESINTATDLVRVSDIQSQIREELELQPMECEKTEVPLSSEAPELKTEETGGVPVQTTSARVIKFTFQRKRKHGILIANGSELCNNLKKKEENKNALLDIEKVIPIEESTQKVNSTEESTQKVNPIEESTQEETHQNSL